MSGLESTPRRTTGGSLAGRYGITPRRPASRHIITRPLRLQVPRPGQRAEDESIRRLSREDT